MRAGATPLQHARFLSAFEQYCAAHKRKLGADRLQQNKLDNDLIVNICVLMGY